MFEREVEEGAEEHGDVNTDAEAARKITLEFTFEPYKDRSGAVVLIPLQVQARSCG